MSDDGVKKILMFSDIEGCQARANTEEPEQSSFLCGAPFYDEIARRLDSDPNLEVAFLGDYFDQGMRVYDSIKGIEMLLNRFNNKKTGIERVHVILGNRDVNKLRFCLELPYRNEVKESINNMTSKEPAEIIVTTKMSKHTDGGEYKCELIVPSFEKGWSAWSSYFFGIYKDEIIQPSITCKGVIEKDSDAGLIKHILMSSMGAGKSENNKMTGLFSFMPYEKIENATDEIAVKYLKASLGIIAKDNDTEDALDLLGFFKKCKLAHVFKGPDGKGKVLLAHGGGFDSEAFFDKAYVDSFGQGMPDVIKPEDYHITMEKFRRILSGDKTVMVGGKPVTNGGFDRKRAIDAGNAYSAQNAQNAQKMVLNVDMPPLPLTPQGEIVSEQPLEEKPLEEQPLEEQPVEEQPLVEKSVEVYNNLLQTVIDEIREKKFTWRFVLLQALGLKPDREDARYKSLIQSCSQDGCSGKNEDLKYDPRSTKLRELLEKSGITHVSYGHKPVCFPIPLIYQRDTIPNVTFISNDTSNGNRKVTEIGSNTAIGTSVTFKADGTHESAVEVISLGEESPAWQYDAMFGPFSSNKLPPTYIESVGQPTTLLFEGKKLSFNNLLKPPASFGQLEYSDYSDNTTAVGGKRRSRHRKQQKSKRGSTRGGSKKTRRSKHKHTKHGRKMRKQ